jgi:hypothetical protein
LIWRKSNDAEKDGDMHESYLRRSDDRDTDSARLRPREMPGPPPAPPKSRQQIEGERAADQAYKDSLKNIPDKRAADPWGIARGADTPKVTAKTHPAKPPAKIGSTTN